MNEEDLMKLADECEVYSKQNEHDKVLDCYNQIIEMIPDEKENLTFKAFWFFKKAVTYYQMGKPIESLANFNKALELNPNNEQIPFNKGVIYSEFFKTKKTEQISKEVIRCYNDAIKIKPDYVEAMYNKGLFLSEIYREKEAIESFDQILKINPNHTDALASKGDVLSDLGKYDKALSCYDKALKINPKYARIWLNKAKILWLTEKTQEALYCLRESKKIDSEIMSNIDEIEKMLLERICPDL